MREPLTARTLDEAFPSFGSFEAPVALTGGSLNFVWRVRCGRGAVIAKRAPPYVATAPALALTARRLLTEARALRLFDGRLAPQAREGVRPPLLLGFSRRAWLLLEEDAGPGPDLSSALSRPALFDTLGTFIGSLHRETLHDREARRRFDNAAIQRARLDSQYAGVAAFAERCGARDAADVGATALDLGGRLLLPGRCLTMGDLWPPSVLVRGRALRLIDWEFAHFGNPAQDVAHLLAHLFMAGAVQGEPAEAAVAAAAFASAYRQAAGRRFAELWDCGVHRDAGLHYGCELLARAWGPFRGSGPLAGAATSSPAHLAVTALGLESLRRPTHVEALGVLAG